MTSTTARGGGEFYDAVVIGAGQAGLAIGYYLRREGFDFRMLDTGPAVGHIWRSRWDSLRLFTPAEYDSLPGMAFPAPAGSYPTIDEVADYLRDYATIHELPVRLNTPVTRLEHDAGYFRVTTPAGSLAARQVVVATGPFQQRYIPRIAAGAAPSIRQLHSADYRNSAQLPTGGHVLVVGAANSGLQIAAELAGDRRVTVSAGSKPAEFPKRIAGRDLFFWLKKSGLMTMPAERRLARRFRERGDLVIGSSTAAMRRRGIDFRPRLTRLAGGTATFADGTCAELDAIVWATGYRSDYGWLGIPGAVEAGMIRHRHGVTDVPGLYVLGLPWLTSRGSGLLGFVRHDAERLARRMAAAPAMATAPTIGGSASRELAAAAPTRSSTR